MKRIVLWVHSRETETVHSWWESRRFRSHRRGSWESSAPSRRPATFGSESVSGASEPGSKVDFPAKFWLILRAARIPDNASGPLVIAMS